MNYQLSKADRQLQKMRIFNPPKAKPFNIDDYPIVILDPDDSNYKDHLVAFMTAKQICLDIETYGEETTKDGFHPWKSNIRLIQIFDGKNVYIADVGGRHFLQSSPLFSEFADPRKQIRERFKDFFKALKNYCLRKPVIGQNLIFDSLRLLIHFGIRIVKPRDTMLGFQVFFGDYPGDEDKSKVKKKEPIVTGGYGLGNLSKVFLNHELDKTLQKSDFGGQLSDDQIKYAAKDTIVTWHLYEYLENLYQAKTPLHSSTIHEIWELENQVIPYTCQMIVDGLPVDRNMVEDYLEQYQTAKNKLLIQWSEKCPNITYNQVAEIRKRLTEDGIYLDDLDKSSVGEYQHPLIDLRLQLKGLDAKINNLLAFKNSSERDGRVHTMLRTLTGFGRFASGGGEKDLPNMQSITAKSNPHIANIRELSTGYKRLMFITQYCEQSVFNQVLACVIRFKSVWNLPNPRACIRPPEGYGMGVVDLAGAHGRIAADQADDPVAIEGNNDDTIDNHSKVAVYVAKTQGLDWTWEDIARLKGSDNLAKSFRDTAKNTYYGWLNGAGAKRIQDQITGNTGHKPKLEDCKAAIEGCKILYPKVLEHRKNLLKRLKYNAVLVFGVPVVVNELSDGARILLPMLVSDYTEEYEPPYTQSLASIWSRIEATAVKRAFIRVCQESEKHPEWDLKVVLIVHDELDVTFREEFAEQALTCVNTIVGEEFQRQLKKVHHGCPSDWRKLRVKSWADK